MATVDLWQGAFDVMDLRGMAPRCPGCAEGRFEEPEAAPSAVLCGRDAVQIRAPRGARLDLGALAERLVAAGSVARNEYLVRFTAADAELVVFADGRAIVKGVHDPALARTLYAKYVGA
jgi:adenylyltransferase/sulfurtransferase